MKSSVFRSRRNEDGRWQLRSGADSEFHADGPGMSISCKEIGLYSTTLKCSKLSKTTWNVYYASGTIAHTVISLGYFRDEPFQAKFNLNCQH